MPNLLLMTTIPSCAGKEELGGDSIDIWALPGAIPGAIPGATDTLVAMATSMGLKGLFLAMGMS